MLLPVLLACSPAQIATDDLTVDDNNPVEQIGDDTDSAHDHQPDSGVEDIIGGGSSEDKDSDLLFSEETIPVFEITMSDQAFDELIDNPYDYVQATLTYEGVTYGPVGVRTKGENSWRPINEKASLKFDFNRYEGGPGRFYSMKGLTFNAMNEDYSMMHERVAYRMYREAGVPAARAHHAVLYLNGELYGLFTMLDTVDDVFLERWFEDATGSMYEQHDGDFTDDYVQDDIYFQLEEGDGDRSALQGVADALEGSGEAAIAAAGEHLNWESFQRYWAVGGVVQNFDAYPFRFAGDDCHVYHDPTTDKLHYIPHGVDESFYYNYNIETQAGGHLSVKCREVSSCRDEWAEHVYEVLDVLDEIDLAAYAETVRDQIEDHARDDPNRNYTWSYVEYYQESMIDNIEGRRAEISSDIGPRP